MKTTIKNFNVNWLDIKNACRQTVSMGDSKLEPTSEWKRKLLICRHSPIRIGSVLWKSEDVPFYVMGHIVRHNVGCTPFVSTSREDRTGIPRNERKQTDFVDMQMTANIEALINISERRLCTCADPTTRKYWGAVLEAVKEYDEDIYWACVPQCVRCGGCVEPFSECTFYDNFSKNLTPEQQTDIMARYDAYNEYRGKVLSLKREK
ncbi:MAG: thymidylate synthase ThyX [Candidatus Coprovivens sp.]